MFNGAGEPGHCELVFSQSPPSVFLYFCQSPLPPQMPLKTTLIHFNAVTARGQTIIKVQACTEKKRSVSSFHLL